jgi:molecular chaperone GrpE
MSDPTPPDHAGGTSGRPAGPLTPDVIDAVLADFRRWLEDLATAPPAKSPPVTHGGLNVDLATVVAAFTALRHEVNLQTKASRAQSEQLAAALDLLGQSASQSDDDSAVRPLVKALIEAYDTLARTTAEIDRLREATAEPGPFWTRLFARSDKKNTERLTAAINGLRMSERRIERLMREVGLEPIETMGKPFDPETMEAVEAIASGEHTPGVVVEELRRGYLWDGRVFRFSQVQVAK